MMTSSRRAKNYVVALTFVLLAGCQNYNFNPVGHCIVQPGSTRIKMDSVATADVLFVVDDSFSMDPMQIKLRDSFAKFVSEMASINKRRVDNGFEPVDFHVAITSTSIFYAFSYDDPKYCLNQSGTQCCTVSGCATSSCTPGESCGGNKKCVAELSDTGQATQCCDVGTCEGAGNGCFLGDQCADFSPPGATTFSSSAGGCKMSYATPGSAYPAGNFLADSGNPKVIHFLKNLNWSSWDPVAETTTDATLNQLISNFKENVIVGSCGSGQEQPFEAARQAIQKALDGKQPGVERSEWPHQGAKLVVAWVGNEDDCSNRLESPLTVVDKDPAVDSCTFDRDSVEGSVDGRRLIPVTDYATFFSDLVTPDIAADFGAAFIVSATHCGTETTTYTPAYFKAGGPVYLNGTGTCTEPDPEMNVDGSSGGVRYIKLDSKFKDQGYDVVEGSVCEDNFGITLAAIAALAEPPTSLELDTVPAAGEVTVLKIFRAAGGSTTCVYGTDWWFIEKATSTAPIATPTKFVFINHKAGGNCEALFGDTYSAEYIGMLPPEGCTTAADCAAALGGDAAAWDCSIEAGNTRGTCLCAQ